jgi:uncharacterized protein YdgA (DUF945 family)
MIPLFGQLRAYAVAAALAGLALAASWFSGRRSAQAAAKIRKLEDEVNAYETRNEVENRVATERDARQRLRDDWSE